MHCTFNISITTSPALKKRISHASPYIVHSECCGLCVTVTLTMKCSKIKSLTRAKQNDSLLKANLIKNTGVNDCHLQKGKVTMLQICIGSTNYNSYHYCMVVLDMYDFDMHMHWLRVFQLLKLIILDIMKKFYLSYYRK